MKHLRVVRKLRRVCLFLTGAGALLYIATATFGQQSSQTQVVARAPVEWSLKVLPLAGDGAENDLERRILAPIVVEVLDRNDMPVLGADVVFRFPATGPGASFSDQKKSRTVKSNAQGEAAATDWTDNGETGKFKVQISARYGDQVGESTISMANAAKLEYKSTLIPTRKTWTPPR
jgi:hypothetical protein